MTIPTPARFSVSLSLLVTYRTCLLGISRDDLTRELNDFLVNQLPDETIKKISDLNGINQVNCTSRCCSDIDMDMAALNDRTSDWFAVNIEDAYSSRKLKYHLFIYSYYQPSKSFHSTILRSKDWPDTPALYVRPHSCKYHPSPHCKTHRM